MKHNLEIQIKNIMSIVFEDDLENLGDNPSLDTVRTWDSLKHMNLVIALEDHFNCKFSEDEIYEMDSYKKIKSIIEKYQSS